tara:strand:- start:40 stop:1038 length:999 start_codon:yes stop_codon:yes gene_type:complete
MAFDEQLFVGRIGEFSPKYNNIVAITGTTISGNNQITSVAAFNGTFDTNLLRVGQTLNVVSGGGFSGDIIITNISGTTLTVDANAIANFSGGVFTADTPSGTYFFNSASFFDPQSNLTVNNITGSNEVDYDETLSPIYGVIGQASDTLGGSIVPSKFHLYKVTDVTYRDLGTAKFSGFVAWGEQGVESDSGDALLDTANQTLAIGALSISSSNVAIYDNAALNSTPAGSSVAGYQIALPGIIDQALTESDGFPYTGSAQITGSLSVTGSSIVSLDTNENFLINSTTAVTQSLFKIDDEGIATFRVREDGDAIPTPVIGQIWFSASGAFIGVE